MHSNTQNGVYFKPILLTELHRKVNDGTFTVCVAE